MSTRKIATSYSSLRRQVRAQVYADIHSLTVDSHTASSDESGDECVDNTYCCQIDSFCEPRDCDPSGCQETANDVGLVSDDGCSISCIPGSNSKFIDFTDCHWVDSDSFSETEDLDICDQEGDIVNQISEWANKYRLPHVAITELMHILKPHLSAMPNCSRTLLHTPRSCNVKQLKSGGEYCHLGLAKGLREVLGNGPDLQTTCLELQFNVDGLPLFKSSNSSLWPILCRLKNVDCSEPFVIGIYYGNEKPADACEFLAEFVEEASHLTKNGLIANNKLYSISINSFVCDAPARAFIKGIKCHSGYAACEKCTEHGEYLGKVIYPGTSAPLRTDVAFDEMADEDHHVRPCPLRHLSVGGVSQFGLDYMHLVCLGVVRRLLLYWKGPIGPLSVRLGSRVVNELSQKLLSLCPHIPSDFARKPRSMVEILRWKATEFRQFLLYTGPVILREFLSVKLYHHFMLLSVGIRILSCPQLALKFCDYANELLVLFVTEAGKLYGKEIYVYNVHCLIHLAGDVKNLGTLDQFSSFPFENKLGQLKRMIRKPQFPIQQIVYRLAEQQQTKSRDSANTQPAVIVKHEHNAGPLVAEYRSYRQFRWLQSKFVISLTMGNSCILATDGYPALVQNILENDGIVVLMCQHFATVEDAFSYPMASSRLGIYKVVNKMTDLFALPLCSVSHKCALLPVKDGFVVMPLLH